MSRPTYKVGIQPNTRLLRIERGTECWHVWINANLAFTSGTMLALHDNGRIERITTHVDGYEDIMLIKEEDNVR